MVVGRSIGEDGKEKLNRLLGPAKIVQGHSEEGFEFRRIGKAGQALAKGTFRGLILAEGSVSAAETEIGSSELLGR